MAVEAMQEEAGVETVVMGAEPVATHLSAQMLVAS
jgi:hypothetical protein